MTEQEKQLPELKKRTLTAKQHRLHNTAVGARGEQIACTYLTNKAYQILEKNVLVGAHEVDIIALDRTKNELVFIEVKTRNSTLFGTPANAVSSWKLKSMEWVAQTYVQYTNCAQDYRFDIITVTIEGTRTKQTELKIAVPRITHFENISWP